jgi:hypothetical protein
MKTWQTIVVVVLTCLFIIGYHLWPPSCTSLSPENTNMLGRVQTGWPTSCRVTFIAPAFHVAPHCVISDETTARAPTAIATPVGLLISDMDSHDTVTYFCVERPSGVE